MNHTILIIDDDEKLSRLLEKYLPRFGLEAFSASTPSAGLKLLKTKSPDLVVLDVMLPEMDGFEVCKTIRKSSDIPIIMLTALGELTDKVVGLELGADDYLPKPFEPRELVARINSVLRRTRSSLPDKIMEFEDLKVDFSRQKAFLADEELDLTTNEFAALALLSVNKGKVLDRDQILQELRGIDCDAFNRSVDITISRLRQKLQDDPKKPDFIKTVWGTGYLFLGGKPE